MTCCPSSSSVWRARFVTAGSIDFKLCTYVHLGEMTLGLATRANAKVL
jgi:hypothetical protein